MKRLKVEFNLTYLFITHDLAVARSISHRVAVMYLGQIAEYGPAEMIYAPPYHPYTEALLSAVPVPDPETEQKQIRLSGDVPSALEPPAGCRFHTRCPIAEKRCEVEDPDFREYEPDHWVACHFVEKAQQKMR